MTVTVIAILASVAIPTYTKTIRRAQGRAARDVLLSFYAGEKARQAASGAYVDAGCCSVNPQAVGCVPTVAATCITEWQQVFMDVPNLNNPTITYHTTLANATAFQASTRWIPTAGLDPSIDNFMQIDQTGQITCLETTGIFADKPEYGCFP